MPNIKEFFAYLVFTIGLLVVGALVAAYIYGLWRFNTYIDGLENSGWWSFVVVVGFIVAAGILQKVFEAIEIRLAGRAARREFEDRSPYP